jgi:hypothetical protein
MSQVAAKNYTSLDAIAAAAAGTAFESGGRTQATWGYTTTGSPTGVSVQFEVSHDGVNYERYGEALVGTSSGAGAGTGTFRFCRLNCTTLSGGSSPTLTGTIYLSG